MTLCELLPHIYSLQSLDDFRSNGYTLLAASNEVCLGAMPGVTIIMGYTMIPLHITNKHDNYGSPYRTGLRKRAVPSRTPELGKGRAPEQAGTYTPGDRPNAPAGLRVPGTYQRQHLAPRLGGP